MSKTREIKPTKQEAREFREYLKRKRVNDFFPTLTPDKVKRALGKAKKQINKTAGIIAFLFKKNKWTWAVKNGKSCAEYIPSQEQIAQLFTRQCKLLLESNRLTNLSCGRL